MSILEIGLENSKMIYEPIIVFININQVNYILKYDVIVFLFSSCICTALLNALSKIYAIF